MSVDCALKYVLLVKCNVQSSIKQRTPGMDELFFI